MLLVIAILLNLFVLVILVIFWLVRRRRGKEKTTSSNPTSRPESSGFKVMPDSGTADSVKTSSNAGAATGTAGPEPPTFKIVALGLSGAGKTVFLSSMFHSLNFRDDRRSYFLETSFRQRLALNEIYSTISDTLLPWPPGTREGETREYLFDCVAFDDLNVKHHVLSINYLDYAGELFENAQAEPGALQTLSGHINGADALLCVIDGYRVLQLLKNEPKGRNYLQFSMQTMIGMMQGVSRPIHLVISKWDIVRGFGEPVDADEQFRLGRVIDALMAFGHIRSLVYGRGSHQITRIIPVSAVGSNFARIDPGGTMAKRHDGKMWPINVDVPLCAVVPDLFKQVESSLDDKARHELNVALRKRISLGPGEVLSGVAALLKRPTGIVVRTVMHTALGRDIGSEAAMMFLDWAAQPYKKRASKIGERASSKSSASSVHGQTS